MSEDISLARDEMQQLRPAIHLQGRGCLDEAGEPRGDLAGNFATAACFTFEDAELAPQELLTVYEAIKQCLELNDATDPAQRIQLAIDEAFEVASGLLGKDVNGAIVDWVQEWIPFITNEKAITAFMQHLSSVSQQYSLVMGLKHGD